MKRSILLISYIIFTAFTIHAQVSPTPEQDSDVSKELQYIRGQRSRDSLKIESLQKAIQELIDLQKNQVQEQYKREEDSLRKIHQLAEIEKIKYNTEGASVVLDNDTLFTIYANLAAYSNKERARSAQQRIQMLYEDPFFQADSLKIGNIFGVKTINYKSQVILAVDEIDALWVGTTSDSLAHFYKKKIADAVILAKKNHSFQTKLKQIGEICLILIVVFTLFKIIHILIGKLKNYLIHHNRWFAHGITIRNYQLIPKRILNVFVSRFVVLLKFFLYVLVVISSVTLALKVFPSTEIWARKAQDTILEPLQIFYQSLLAYIPKLIIILIIIIAVNWLLSIFKYFAQEIENENLKFQNFYPEWARPTYQIIRLLIIVLTLILIFPYLPGSDTTAFQGISVFLGILISIGSSSAIANAVAGIVITYMRPFKKNDWIKTGDVIGLVIEKNTLVTRLKTINNEDVSVPNSAILSGATINYSSIGKTDGLVITTEVQIDLEIDFHTVEKLLIRAANLTSGITNRLAPYVFYKKINDSTTTYEINAITFEPQNMYYIQSDLVKNVQKVFKENLIPLRSIAFIHIEPNIHK